MKKNILKLLFSFFSWSYMNAQEGNVGINTYSPEARLEILSNSNIKSNSALKITDKDNKELFNLKDDGTLGYNKEPIAVLDLLVDGSNDFIIKKNTSITIDSKSLTPSFQHIKYAGGGGYNNNNPGGQLLLFDIGGNAVNNVVQNGIYIHPANPNVPAGLYLGSNRFNGFSLDRLPTTDIDVGGNIRLREYKEEVIKDADCDGRFGEMIYYKGHFYGCNSSKIWNQLDN